MFSAAVLVIIGDLVAVSASGDLIHTIRGVGVGGFVGRELGLAGVIGVENESWCSRIRHGRKGRVRLSAIKGRCIFGHRLSFRHPDRRKRQGLPGQLLRERLVRSRQFVRGTWTMLQ